MSAPVSAPASAPANTPASARRAEGPLRKQKTSHDLPSLASLSLSTRGLLGGIFKRQRSFDEREATEKRQRKADEADVESGDEGDEGDEGDDAANLLKAVVFDFDGTLTTMRPLAEWPREQFEQFFDTGKGRDRIYTSAASVQGFEAMSKAEHEANFGGEAVLDGEAGLAALLAQAYNGVPPVEFYIVDPDAKQAAVLHALRETDLIGFFSSPGTKDGARVFCADVAPFADSTDAFEVHNWMVVEKIMKREIGDRVRTYWDRPAKLKKSEVLYVDDNGEVINDSIQGVKFMGVQTLHASVALQWDEVGPALFDAVLGVAD